MAILCGVALSVEQERRLIRDLNYWALVLDAAVHRLVNAIPAKFSELASSGHLELIDVAGPLFGMRSDLHMVPLSLRQIDEHLQQLEGSSAWTDQVATAASDFWEQYNSEQIRDMRNLLEHSAEYVAGEGSKMELVKDPDDSWPGMLADNRLVHITIFGRSYAVRAVITAAITIAKELAKEADESET